MLCKVLVLTAVAVVIGACGRAGGFEEEYDYFDRPVDDLSYEDPPPDVEDYLDEEYLDEEYLDEEVDAAYEEGFSEACAEVLDDGPLYFDGRPYEEADCLDGLGEDDGGGYVDPDDAADPAYDEPVGEPSG